VDQLDRDESLAEDVITSFRQSMANAEASSDKKRNKMLNKLAKEVNKHASTSDDAEKVEKLANTLKALASM
jgi:DNA-binding ferritin-like protein